MSGAAPTPWWGRRPGVSHPPGLGAGSSRCKNGSKSASLISGLISGKQSVRPTGRVEQTARVPVWVPTKILPRVVPSHVNIASYIARPPTQASSSWRHLNYFKGDLASYPICCSSRRVLVFGRPCVSPRCQPLHLGPWCIHPSSMSTRPRFA